MLAPGSISEQQIALVEFTWARALADAGAFWPCVAQHFLAEGADITLLFEPLSADLGTLVEAPVAQVLAGLRSPERLLPKLQSWGAQLALQGLVESDYMAAGGALLAGLAQVLGEEYSQPVHGTWSLVIRQVTQALLTGARQVREPLGPLTVRQRRLVQASWALIMVDEAVRLRFGRIWFGEWFARAPWLRTLFADDTTEQQGRLVAALDEIVHGLTAWSQLAGRLEQLGLRHHGYGVQAADYASLGRALLSALNQCLRARFTPELRSYWGEVYSAVADALQGSGAAARLARAQPSSAR